MNVQVPVLLMFVFHFEKAREQFFAQLGLLLFRQFIDALHFF